MSVSRISDEVGEAFAVQIAEQVIEGEDIHWDATVLPGDGKAPVVFLTIGLSGAVLGTKVQVGMFVQNPSFINEHEAKQIVTQLLEMLRAQRSNQLADGAIEVNPTGPAPHGAVLLG